MHLKVMVFLELLFVAIEYFFKNIITITLTITLKIIITEGHRGKTRVGVKKPTQ